MWVSVWGWLRLGGAPGRWWGGATGSEAVVASVTVGWSSGSAGGPLPMQGTPQPSPAPSMFSWLQPFVWEGAALGWGEASQRSLWGDLRSLSTPSPLWMISSPAGGSSPRPPHNACCGAGPKPPPCQGLGGNGQLPALLLALCESGVSVGRCLGQSWR